MLNPRCPIKSSKINSYLIQFPGCSGDKGRPQLSNIGVQGGGGGVAGKQEVKFRGQEVGDQEVKFRKKIWALQLKGVHA